MENKKPSEFSWLHNTCIKAFNSLAKAIHIVACYIVGFAYSTSSKAASIHAIVKPTSNYFGNSHY